MQKLIVTVALLACLAAVALASIDTDPVRVTHRNSGPKYDLSAENEVERTRLVPMAPDAERVVPQMQPPPQPQAQPGADMDDPRGHLTVRRIFLFPVRMHSHSTPDSDQDASHDRFHDQPPFNPLGSLFPNSMWRRPAFMSPSEERPTFERPLPPSMMGGEREETQERPTPDQMVDPFRLMLTILRHTLNSPAGAMLPGQPELNQPDGEPTNGVPQPPLADKPTSDLDKEGSMAHNPFKSLLSALEGDKPQKNETKEEVVEIEGKKFLRKLVVNKHVGDNMFFLTKHIVLTPLNETDTDATTTPSAPSSPVTPEISTSSPIEKEQLEPKVDASTTTTSTTEIASEAPTTSTSAGEPSSTASEPSSSPSETESSTNDQIATTTTTDAPNKNIEITVRDLKEILAREGNGASSIKVTGAEVVQPASSSTTEKPTV